MLLLAFLLGIVAGLRVFTGAAVWSVITGTGVWRILLPIAAVAEYLADASPKIPARTQVGSLIVRCLSGAFAGWIVASRLGYSIALPMILGVLGALAGTYGGYRVRIWLIARAGVIAAAIIEDVVAIGLAVFVVTRVS